MINNIHFIDAKGLADKLKAQKVTDELALKQIIALAIIIGFSVEVQIIIVPNTEALDPLTYLSDFVIWVVCAFIHIHGLKTVYQANKKGDDSDFFKRLLCLTLPVSLRVILGMLAILIPIGAVLAVFSDEMSFLPYTTFGLALSIIYHLNPAVGFFCVIRPFSTTQRAFLVGIVPNWQHLWC